ncbi:MAG TPA: APC family permease [Bryobacterales bacterium]|jgi:APA family basic amino acid/polyamine antiporter|nr:APC family permease [Bryobacterales bacterium]
MDQSCSPQLVRAVGLFSLTALALNGVIGAGIFVLPATVAKFLGRTSPLGYIICGVATVLIVLCFAEAGSLFETAGGPYVYAREAFGGFIGFEVGWMFLLGRLTGAAAVSNAFADYLGFFWPAVASGPGRSAAITLLMGALALVNVLGVRYGAWTINLLTIGKLLPLLVFIAAGLFFADPRSYSFSELPDLTSLRSAALVLMFAFGGFEYAAVPSEEVINPRRNLPIALVSAIALVVVIYLLIQIVALGTLPGLGTSPAPLAAAGERFLGALGAALLTLGAVMSTTGNSSAQLLVGPRILYAMAEGKQLPALLGRVHARFHTPYVSMILFALTAWGMALFSNFSQLAVLSAIARLLYYLTTCLAVPVLRRKMPAAERRVTLPGGAVIPALAVAVSIWLLTGSSRSQAAAGGIALLAGGALYWSYAGYKAAASKAKSPAGA